MTRWQKFSREYVQPWFRSSEDVSHIKPIKVVITLFAFLFLAALADKIIHPNRLSDMFVLGLVGSLGILLGADTWRSNAKDNFKVQMNGHGEKPKPAAPAPVPLPDVGGDGEITIKGDNGNVTRRKR